MARSKQFTTWRNVHLVPLSLPVDGVKISFLHSSTLVSRRSSHDPRFSFLVEEVEDLIVRLHISSGQSLAVYGVKKHLTGKRSLQQMVGIYNVIRMPPPKRRKRQPSLPLDDPVSECSLHNQLGGGDIVKLSPANELKPKDDPSILGSRDVVKMSPAKDMKHSMSGRRNIIKISPAKFKYDNKPQNMMSSRDIVKISPAQELRFEGEENRRLCSTDIISPTIEVNYDSGPQKMLSSGDVKETPAQELKSADNQQCSRDIVKTSPNKQIELEGDLQCMLSSGDTEKIKSAIDKPLAIGLKHIQLQESDDTDDELDLLSEIGECHRTIRKDYPKLEEFETSDPESEPEPLKREITNDGSLIMVTLTYSEVNAGHSNTKTAIRQPAKEKVVCCDKQCTQKDISLFAEIDSEKMKFTQRCSQNVEPGSLTKINQGPNSKNLLISQADIESKRLILKPVLKKRYIPGHEVEQSKSRGPSDAAEQIAINEPATRPKSMKKRKWLPDKVSYPEAFKFEKITFTEPKVKPRPPGSTTKVHPIMQWINPHRLASERAITHNKSLKRENSQSIEETPHKYQKLTMSEPDRKYQREHASTSSLSKEANPVKKPDVSASSLKRGNSEPVVKKPFKFVKITYP